MRSGIGKLANLIVAIGACGFATSLAQPARAQMDFSRMLFSGDRSDNRQVGYYDNGYAQSPPPNYQGNNANGNQNGPDYQRPQYYTALRDRAHDNGAQQPTPAQGNNQNRVAQTGYYQQPNGYRQYRGMRNDRPQDEMLMADASANETPVQVQRPIRSVVSGPGAQEAMHPSPTTVFIEGNKVLVGQLKGGETIMPGTPMQRSRSMMPGGSTIQNGPMPGPATQAGPVTWGPIQYGDGNGDNGQMMMGEGGEMGEGGPMMGGPPPSCGCGCDGYTNPYCNDCSCACSGQHGCGFGKHYSSCCGGGCSGGCGNNCGGGCCGGSGGGCGGEGGCGGGGCGGNCCNPYGRPWFLAPIDRFFGIGPYANSCDGWWCGRDLTVFAGTHNFRSPVDSTFNGDNSNFGFQEGVNWAFPIWRAEQLGAQVGVEITQSDFFGTQNTNDNRNQIFLTGGLFHRAVCGEGLQGGVVFDWLHDEFSDTIDVTQLRGEISWLCDCHNEVGFWFGVGLTGSTGQRENEVEHYNTIDQYNFFYRRRFCAGGDIRFWGGFSAADVGTHGDSGGLVGVDFEVPIACCWSIDGGFNYLIPSDRGDRGFANQTWNLGFNLVWHMGCNARCNCDPYRPLFDVADNGSLMTSVR